MAVVQFEVFGNARSLTPTPTPNAQQRRAWGPGTRAPVCPFTPNAGANGDPKTRARFTGFGMTIC